MGARDERVKGVNYCVDIYLVRLFDAVVNKSKKLDLRDLRVQVQLIVVPNFLHRPSEYHSENLCAYGIFFVSTSIVIKFPQLFIQHVHHENYFFTETKRWKLFTDEFGVNACES